ncbi:MAG: 30S ribosomal protein S13 [archaeon]
MSEHQQKHKWSKGHEEHGTPKQKMDDRAGHREHTGEPAEDIRLIVRIAGIDLNGQIPIERALTKIKGIGIRAAKNIAIAFEKAHGIPATQTTGKLSEEDSKKLEEVVLNPAKFKVPAWSFNRKKDFVTGTDAHLVMSDLDFSLRNDLQRLKEIKSYRGFRHTWGLPVRGQRTKSTHRGKGGVVGVTKKDVAAAAGAAKAAAAPAAAGKAPAAGKPAEKKK